MYKYRIILFISAIFISVIAEFISIYGLSKLLGGNKYSWIIISMGIGFAIGKLLIATLLKLNSTDFHKYLRNYLVGSLIVLSMLTSVGIYGFLSDGYTQTKQKDDYVQTKINLIKKKKEHFENNVSDVKLQLVSVNSSVEKLRTSLSTDNQTQQVVKGQLVTNIVSSNKKGVQIQLDKTLDEKLLLEQRLLTNNDSISSLDLKIIETEQSSNVASELGPLKYISSVSGIQMDHVVNYLLLLIILIFDPLALSLLWAFFSLKKPMDIVSPVKEILVPEVIIPEPSPEVVKKVRNVTKRLGRPKKTNTEINDMIDSIIENKPQPAEEKVNQKKTSRVVGNSDLNEANVKQINDAIEIKKKL